MRPAVAREWVAALTEPPAATTLGGAAAAEPSEYGKAPEMSEQPSHRTSTSEDEVSESGATSEGFGNLSIEDDAEGTVNPADLAGTAGPDDDAVDG
jgi:hypothetical protein